MTNNGGIVSTEHNVPGAFKRQWYDVNCVAELLGLNPDGVRHQWRLGNLKGHKGHDKRIRFHIDDINRFVKGE